MFLLTFSVRLGSELPYDVIVSAVLGHARVLGESLLDGDADVILVQQFFQVIERLSWNGKTEYN